MPPVIHDSDDEAVGGSNIPSSSKGNYSDSSSELSDAEDIEVDLEAEDEVDEGDEEDGDEGNQYSDETLMSDDDAGYKLEDPDEIDEDLELKDDRDRPEPAPKIKVSVSGRETRKRQLTYYEDDEDEDDEDDEQSYARKPAKVKSTRGVGRPPKSSKLKRQIQPTDLDEDLILTDEETEYNPMANPDLTKMTSRQRAMYEEDEDKSRFLDLDDNLKPKKKKKQDDEQIALRKAESARRRQDYKTKQEEEEKRDIVNKLLKRRATKTRENQTKEGPVETSKVDKARRPALSHPALLRYTNNTTTLQGNSLLSFNE